jgi:hypothetical protein
MSIVVNICKAHSIDFDPNELAPQIAMKLFLENREAFKFAWSRYLLHASTSRLSIYNIPKQDLTASEEHLQDFGHVCKSGL